MNQIFNQKLIKNNNYKSGKEAVMLYSGGTRGTVT
jgi:hypothetical protein